MTPKTSFSLAAVAAVALMAGCASEVKLAEPAPVETRTPGAVPSAAGGVAQTPGARPAGTPQSSVATVNLTQPTAATPSASQIARIVYFDFDSFVIKDEFKPAVEGHAKVMSTNKQRRMVVEGHADERGSREYNLALGQKRAEAVVKTLSLLGVGPAQVEAVSFGEERPAAQGSDEAAWSKNRRAELKDK
jgi:peptidoglycan-associated lipoprotein